MMFIIDGTGDGNDELYKQDMDRGFCKQLELKLGKQAEYLRGPRVDGLNTFDIADKMLNKIVTYYETGVAGLQLIDLNNTLNQEKYDHIYFITRVTRAQLIEAHTYLINSRYISTINAMGANFTRIIPSAPNDIRKIVANIDPRLNPSDDMKKYINSLCMYCSLFDDDIFLAGHSRGGCAVIYIAQKLKEKGIKVKAMFLFDAVARTHKGVPILGDDFEEIPDNVRVCYHALRDKEWSNHFKEPLKELYNKCVKSIPVGGRAATGYGISVTTECGLLNKARIDDSIFRVMLRNEITILEGRSINFGNCGTKPKENTRLVTEPFKGAHGTMGGAVTATSPLSDQRSKYPDNPVLAGHEIMALEQVNNWMSEKLCNEGVLSKGQTILDKEHIQKEMQYIDKAKLYVHREFGF